MGTRSAVVPNNLILSVIRSGASGGQDVDGIISAGNGLSKSLGMLLYNKVVD